MTTPQENTTYHGKDGAVKSTTSSLPELGPKEILLKITHSGLCSTDLAYLPYGIALGHEGVGIVLAIGSEVTQFAVGDRAGGGYHRNSCGHCSYCLSGQDIWCYERSIYGEKDYGNGTIAGHYIGTETYLHKIPEALESEHAAPLQCAGATVYNALVGVAKPGERIGIVGIGGLGHLAVQMARKMGAEVVVFSTSSNKEEEAKDFGATEFYLLHEVEKVSKPVNTRKLVYADQIQVLGEECRFSCRNHHSARGTSRQTLAVRFRCFSKDTMLSLAWWLHEGNMTICSRSAHPMESNRSIEQDAVQRRVGCV